MKHDDLPPDVKDKEDKLTKEELLESLEMIMTDYKNQIGWNNGWEEVYQQIKKLIESYDPDTAMWMDRCHELEVKLAQKPKVSREFIIKYRGKLPLHIASYHDKPVQEILSCASTVLINMIKELGIEVEE